MSDPLVDLQFQDFGVNPPPKPTSTNTKNTTGQPATTFHFTDYPAGAGDDDGNDDTGELLKSKPDDNSASPSFWSLAYYQRYFDVDTDVVIGRMINSMIPRIGSNYIVTHIRPTPDLYGPWWIAVTLIFTIGIASNLGGYFALSQSESDYHWSLEFGVVTAAATAIFAYIWLIPLLLYGLFWWRKSEENYTFMEILCAYGYSLTIYVPVSLLWVIPFSWFQWTLIALALILSGSVLVMALWPALRHDNRLVSMSVMFAVIAVNGLMAIGFKEFFFHTVQSASDALATKAASAVSTANIAMPTVAVNRTG